MPQIASTQSTLSILDIKDDVIIMSGGQYRVVLRVKAINFDLLSEDEQDAIIYAYASLINSLEFPIQVVVKTRQLNIASYIHYLERAKGQQTNEALRNQITSYQEFVNKLVIENNVLFKTFYVIIPYDTAVIRKSSIFDPVTNLLPGKAASNQAYTQKEFLDAKKALHDKRDNLMSSFHRIGLKTTPLVSREMIDVFYELYNPEVTETQQIRQEVGDYTTAMVHPSVR
jgi:hypothetical protein